MAKNGKVVFSYTLGDEPPVYNDGKKSGKYTSKDGIIRIGIEKAKRGGKKVSVVYGFGPSEDIQALCKELKSKMGTGGTVKDGAIEIQGDRRKDIQELLEKKGYKTKLAGG